MFRSHRRKMEHFVNDSLQKQKENHKQKQASRQFFLHVSCHALFPQCALCSVCCGVVVECIAVYFGSVFRRRHSLPHVGSSRDEFSKAFRVSKSVAGPANGSLAASDCGCAAQHQILCLCLGLGDLLLESHFVVECRPSVYVVEAFRYDWHNQHSDCQEYREPENSGAHQVTSRAHVLVTDKVCVHQKCEGEVENYWTPDEEMVEASPVQCVQRTLKRKKKRIWKTVVEFVLLFLSSGFQTA